MRLLLLALLLFPLLSFSQNICLPALGSEIPAAQLVAIDGDTVSLDKFIGDDKAVVIVFRGGWCPYCTKHLSGIGEVAEQIKEAGFRIIGISADDLSHSIAAEEKVDLEYELLSDSNIALSDSLGISFVVDDKTIKRYKTFGINLDESSGHDHHKLPHPAILIYSKGDLQFLHVDPNYKNRLNPEVILSVIKNL